MYSEKRIVCMCIVLALSLAWAGAACALSAESAGQSSTSLTVIFRAISDAGQPEVPVPEAAFSEAADLMGNDLMPETILMASLADLQDLPQPAPDQILLVTSPTTNSLPLTAEAMIVPADVPEPGTLVLLGLGLLALLGWRRKFFA